MYGLRDVIVFSLAERKIIYQIKKLAKSDNCITSLLYVKEYLYIITGQTYGEIKTWKLNNKK